MIFDSPEFERVRSEVEANLMHQIEQAAIEHGVPKERIIAAIDQSNAEYRDAILYGTPDSQLPKLRIYVKGAKPR